MMSLLRVYLSSVLLFVAGCHSSVEGTGTPGNSADHQPYAGIGTDELLHVIGAEPFWSGEVAGGTLTYSTPEMPDGLTIRVDRFAGRNGISFSGTLEEKTFLLVVTPGQCTDGMSDRRYPLHATVQIEDEVRNGCAWSDAHPFTGPAAP